MAVVHCSYIGLPPVRWLRGATKTRTRPDTQAQLVVLCMYHTAGNFRGVQFLWFSRLNGNSRKLNAKINPRCMKGCGLHGHGKRKSGNDCSLEERLLLLGNVSAIL